MYSVVEVKGHQYRVKEGDKIDVELMDVKEGETIVLDRVLFIGGDAPKVGAPVVAGATVTAKVIRHGRSRKFFVLKRKPGKYVKKNGHRQHYTCLQIEGIKA